MRRAESSLPPLFAISHRLCQYLAPSLCVLMGTLLGFLCALCCQRVANGKGWAWTCVDQPTLNFLNFLLESSRE